MDLSVMFFGACAIAFILCKRPKKSNEPATWAATFGGALIVWAMFALGYGVIPHEWLTFANAQLEWGDNSKFIWTSNDDILGIIGIHYPFNFDFPALRDIVVTGMYAQFLVLNVILWTKWQKRFEVKEAPTEETAPARRSRFGRPLRRTKAAEPMGPVAPAPEGV